VARVKEIVFFDCRRHNGEVIGAFLNALGILAGALAGLTQRQPFRARAQNFFKAALGVFAVFFGLHLVWLSMNGTVAAGVKQIMITLLAIVLGNWLGKLSGLQRISNHVGRHAASLLAAGQKEPPGKPVNGVIAVTILFCAAPLGIVGAVADGLSNYFWLLALKAVMDGLAMTSFVKVFRWPVAFAAVPVLVFLDSISVATHLYAAPFLDAHHWTNSVNAAAGFVACATAIVIFEVRRVELANFLPALVLAPLLTKLFS
jgi:uncharacterized membrane protein YqgA involved in biofilm formation